MRATARGKGFTLLELLVVVIIIGILASIAIPQFVRVTERSRQAEARTILGAIRTAEAAYYQQNDTYATAIGQLDIDDPNAAALEHFFSYTVATVAGPPLGFLATATRQTAGGKNPNWAIGYTITLDRAGDFGGDGRGP